jgi:hypothetical protein
VGTRVQGLRYTKQAEGHAELLLVGYSDTDMASDIDSRESTSGIIYFLGRNPITWQASKQRVVTLS